MHLTRNVYANKVIEATWPIIINQMYFVCSITSVQARSFRAIEPIDRSTYRNLLEAAEFSGE